jgi:hypothetical protein
LTPIVPADAANVILPAAFVVIPSVVTLPVLAVNEKAILLTTTLAKSVVNTPVLTVYVVNPIPAANAIVCIVLTFAVTANTESIPELLPCTKLISSLMPALSVNDVFNPLTPIYSCPAVVYDCNVSLAPMLPVVANNTIPAPAVKVWIFAVPAVNVPAALLIDPAVAVILTAFRLVVALTADDPVTIALAPKITLRPALNPIVPEDDVTVELIVRSPVVVAAANVMFPAVLTGLLITSPRPELIVTIP